MADLGNLHFGVHLKDYTAAEADNIKNKLENLTINLKIDGKNVNISHTDLIKKQIEDAVKSVSVQSVNVDKASVKQQIENSTQGVAPQVKVSLLKDNLSSDLQSYLDTKTFNVRIAISNKLSDTEIKKLGTVSVPVKLRVDKKVALEGLKKSVLNMIVPIGVKMKSSKDLVKDIQDRMKNASIKVGIDANKNTLRSNVAQALRGQTFKANLDLVVQKASVQQAIRQAFAQAGLQYNTSASDVRQNLIDTRSLRANAYADAQRALADLRREQAASAQAANQQGSAMQRVNNVAEKQKGIFATLRENVANAYAVYRVGRFLNTAMRIGGEFQQQHVALKTIIGDAQKADVLFERIKNLAVESPFKMMDLTKYTKQLAAFSIPYEELYDTLKRFGDLSAGLGVDMGRIILAYGQVRSAEFLKGTELRQFTEAGIPLVSELARRFTELRGEVVSVGDVFDMISKREVSFGDVQAVLWDLTGEGGKFFEMQAVLTDTLKGKLDKLADSYEIFLSEIANSNNDVLGGTLDLLADTLKHWELIQDAVMSAVAAYGTYKATLLAVAAVQKTAMAVEGIYKTIKSIQFLRNATLGAAAAQAVLNKVTAINPWVALASVLASVAAGMVMFSDKTEDASEAMAKLNAEFEEDKANIEERERKGNKLISVMANEKASIEKRKDAYNSLKGIYPTLFQNITDEQAMMLKEIELRGKVSDAAREELREKLKLKLTNQELKLKEAEDEVVKTEKQYNYAVSQGVFVDKWAKKLEEAKDKADGYKTSIYQTQEALELLDKKEKIATDNSRARWFNEAQTYVESLPEKYKGLMPKEDEERESYFERIGKVVSDLDGKIKQLDKDSSAAQEVLGGYTTERDYANNIYSKILGGLDEEQKKALEDARKTREDQAKKDEQERKEAAKRLVQAYADALKAEISKIGNQWNLFKDLLDATGNEKVSMNLAFGGQISFKSQLEQLEKMIDDEIKKNNLGISVSDLLNMSDEDIANKVNSKVWNEDMVKNLTALTDAYKSENEKVKEESIRNFIEIVKNSNDFAQQIENIERKLQKDLTDLRTNAAKGGLSDEDLARREAELIANAEEEKTKVNFEEFKKSSDWVKVFDDLDRVSDATLDNMISKIEEFARQAHLSEEVTKQLVEAMGKLRDESIERNPLEGFKDAWERRKSLMNAISYTSNGENRYKVYHNGNVYDRSEGEYQNDLAEANDDLKDSALAIADKFQAVANAADLLGGLFENLGIDLGGLSDVLGGTASGAQAGAGIASALGMAGPWGAIAGAAVGMLSSVFAMHDKALQKEIEASEKREELLNTMSDNLESLLEKNLGGLYTMSLDEFNKDTLDDILNRVKLDFNTNGKYYSEETRKKAQEAKVEDSYYKAQLTSLMAQRDEVQEQMRLEEEKKKTDNDKINDYEQELYDLENSIKDFARDLAETLYDIDFQDWAGQLSEALVDAWASGEDAAEAYRNTVTDILKDVGVSVLQQKILEPILNKTMEAFLEQFEKDDGKLTDESMKILSGMYDSAEYAADAIEAYLEGLKKLGIDVSATADDSSSGLSKGIEGVTEDTANLLGSYLNAIRQDVSVKRSLIEKLIAEDVPQMNYLAQAQLIQLQSIAANTLRNANAADKIYDLVNRVVDKGSNKLKV